MGLLCFLLFTNMEHIDADTIERDKPLEPVMNGFALNGRTTGTLGTLGTNHSSLGNGHLQPNGLLMHANTITITGNPLDDKVCSLTFPT